MVLGMTLRASVNEKGAVLLGKNVACDGFDASRPLRIVTHAHGDHLTGLRHSLRTCEKVLMTQPTRDLIDVMRSPSFLRGGYVETVEYGKTLQYGEERITFFKADHILGAAQVLVEDCEGKRIVFTGDFRLDDTPVLDADVLVIEATYGSPWCRRSFEADVRGLLVSMVEKGLNHSPVHIFGYHGKLQEVMQILYKADVQAPFIAPDKIFKISKVCERHGMTLGPLMLSSEEQARELIDANAPYVGFYHMGSKSKIHQEGFRLSVSGWEFGAASRQIADKEFIIALSDHSDFYGLMEYVRRSNPKLVITDNFRVSHGEILAKEIRKRLGIQAVSLPKKPF